jgi:hypothetical protein
MIEDIAASNVAVFSSFFFADFILHKDVRSTDILCSRLGVEVCEGKLIHLCDSGVSNI